MQARPKLLLVEDDKSVSDTLVLALKADFRVIVVETGQLALKACSSEKFAILILDLKLPDMSGASVCVELRNRGFRAPVLVLSGASNVMTKIDLFESGANDYLTKPFVLGELKARLKALSRQSSDILPKTRLQYSDITLDKKSLKVDRSGQFIVLRPKEFAILVYLMERPEEVVSRHELALNIWRDSEIWTNTLDVHVNHLRRKLDKPFKYPLIQTVHGKGYTIDERKNI
jgi:DNA-binding response OmpR family regulator